MPVSNGSSGVVETDPDPTVHMGLDPPTDFTRAGHMDFTGAGGIGNRHTKGVCCFNFSEAKHSCFWQWLSQGKEQKSKTSS
ncbi:hypothetical protein AXF42_Ash011265 [Apostasia shenzhenica]|uniref:Uncharacterized protein n=1 Tax=Apostasia shenzhenica TaxID=1088818 RepID=A0A2I0AE56_9ASPA|nr:hypothetical protein AXF42_Ash011265 [Apostasia shenzhenica]